MSDREICRICRKPLANKEDVRTWEEAFSAENPEEIPDEQTFMLHLCWSEQCGEHTDLGGVVIEDVEEYLIACAEKAEAEVERLLGENVTLRNQLETSISAEELAVEKFKQIELQAEVERLREERNEANKESKILRREREEAWKEYLRYRKRIRESVDDDEKQEFAAKAIDLGIKYNLDPERCKREAAESRVKELEAEVERLTVENEDLRKKHRAENTMRLALKKKLKDAKD